MAWIQDYLDIQMVQSRLTIYMDSLCAKRIGEELFADYPDVEISVQELNVSPIKLYGSEAIRAYYDQLDEWIHKNGDTIGSNLSTCQYIDIDENGLSAWGSWYTFKVDVLGPACGYASEPYPYIISIGKYNNCFVKTKKGWRLKKLCWEPIWKLNTYDCKAAPDGALRPNTLDWPMPYEMYTHNEIEPDADPKDIRFCENVLAIRNLMGTFAHRWNQGDYKQLMSLFEQNQDVKFFRQGMPEAITGNTNIETIMNRYEKKKQWMNESAGIVLLTTGVILPDENGETAKGTWTLLSLDAKSVDGENVVFENRTCRWNVEFVVDNNQWKIHDMQWIDFATMSDLTGKKVAQ